MSGYDLWIVCQTRAAAATNNELGETFFFIVISVSQKIYENIYRVSPRRRRLLTEPYTLYVQKHFVT